MSGEIVVTAMYGFFVLAFIALTAALALDGLGDAVAKTSRKQRRLARNSERERPRG